MSNNHSEKKACPKCQGTNVILISGKANAAAARWGNVPSDEAKKTYKCNGCGHTFFGITPAVGG